MLVSFGQNRENYSAWSPGLCFPYDIYPNSQSSNSWPRAQNREVEEEAVDWRKSQLFKEFITLATYIEHLFLEPIENEIFLFILNKTPIYFILKYVYPCQIQIENQAYIHQVYLVKINEFMLDNNSDKQFLSIDLLSLKK